MPMILDNTMPVLDNVDVGVDDLFGESVDLSLPVRMQSKQLNQRLDELRNRGCCQAVAWSRTGTIASLTPDGLDIELRYLRRHPEDGTWDLSEPTICHLVKGTPAIPLVHLAWAGTSSPDLAVIDAAGRVVIVSFSIALNHPFIQRKWDTDQIDDMHAVVGSYWLNIAPSNSQSYNVMYGPANKHGNGYQYESSFVHAGGPAHPNPAKSALFTITTNGALKMFWSQSTNRFEESTMELESVNSSDDLVTHSTLASEKKYLLLALATSSKQLRLVKLDIHWGGNSQADKASSVSTQNKSLNPTLVEKHLATTSWLQGGPSDTNHDAYMAELSHLEVLPSLMDNTGKNTVPPMVIAIRSRAPNEGSYQMAQSILDRWEAVEQKQNLHPAFEQLGNRRNSISSDPPSVTQLQKIESIIINKVVIAFQTTNFGKLLVLAFADGTVEYRDRFTFEELYTNEDTNKVMNLRQVGWTFSDEGPCQQVAFSPTYCSMIQMGDDGKVRWNKLHYPIGDIGNSMQDVHYAATIAGLTVTAAPSMFYQNNYDDMLAVARQYTTKRRFVQDWITELIRILKIQVDYSEDTHHDALVRNGSLQSCLSIMNGLGFRGELHPRSFQGKFSMLSLNVRNVVVLVTIASNTPLTVRDKLSPLDEPEVVETLAGTARWSLDLLAWLIDSLFELMNDEKFLELLVPPRYNELSGYLHERNNISLHFLLCSSSRGFLSAVCRRLGHLETLGTRAIAFYRRQSVVADASMAGKCAPALQQAYQKMQHATSSGLVQVTEFEKLLTVLGQDIRQCYSIFLPNLVKSQQNPPQGKQIDMAVKAARVQFELAMLLAATPPPAFLRLINKLFKQDLPAFRKATDPTALFFGNYDLLEAQDDKSTLAAKRANGKTYVDTFNRVELKMSPNQQWRRCTRCAAVMADVFGSRPGYTFVLGQQRKCACGGHWALLPKGKLVSS
ncbi:Fc.00g064600.m01.CDS01 [Cosmosporella sp. VM-42]